MQKNIYLAGGCFWGVQHYMDCIPGVVKTEVGYANGRTNSPKYEELKSTGHAETVKVTYETESITLGELLEAFYKVIDPTSLNRQGNDIGTQYRTGVYYEDAADKSAIEDSIIELQRHYDKKLALEVLPLDNFYRAEEYHQKYIDKNPNGYCHIPYEMFELAKQFKTKNKTE